MASRALANGVRDTPKERNAHGYDRTKEGAGWCPFSESHYSSPAIKAEGAVGSGIGVLQGDVTIWNGDTRQYAAFCFFFRTQSRPFDVVMHSPSDQFPYTGTACSVATRTGPINAALFHGHKQRLVSPCIALLSTGLKVGGEERRCELRRHAMLRKMEPKRSMNYLRM